MNFGSGALYTPQVGRILPILRSVDTNEPIPVSGRSSGPGADSCFNALPEGDVKEDE